MGFFWANVKANIEGAVANAKMHYYEEKLRSDGYDEDEDEDEEDDDFVELQCPECGETIYFDEDMLESGEELLCPNCNALLVPTLEEDDDGEE